MEAASKISSFRRDRRPYKCSAWGQVAAHVQLARDTVPGQASREEEARSQGESAFAEVEGDEMNNELMMSEINMTMTI